MDDNSDVEMARSRSPEDVEMSMPGSLDVIPYEARRQKRRELGTDCEPDAITLSSFTISPAALRLTQEAAGPSRAPPVTLHTGAHLTPRTIKAIGVRRMEKLKTSLSLERGVGDH